MVKYKPLFLLLAIVSAVYCLTYIDLMLRARSAYLEGEKYLDWYAHPQLRKRHFESRFESEKAGLDAQKASGAIPEIEYDERIKLAEIERDASINDSSLKEAYHWFQTGAELFSPPESRWVQRSRERMVEAKRLWKAELDAAHIPYQDYMLE